MIWEMNHKAGSRGSDFCLVLRFALGIKQNISWASAYVFEET